MRGPQDLIPSEGDAAPGAPAQNPQNGAAVDPAPNMAQAHPNLRFVMPVVSLGQPAAVANPGIQNMAMTDVFVPCSSQLSALVSYLTHGMVWVHNESLRAPPFRGTQALLPECLVEPVGQALALDAAIVVSHRTGRGRGG